MRKIPWLNIARVLMALAVIFLLVTALAPEAKKYGAVSGSLVPISSNTSDVGISAFQWRDAFFSRNLTVGGTSTVTGAISGASVASSGAVSGTTITGSSNITGANILTSGIVAATGAISGASVTSTGAVSGTTITGSSNITGANLITSGAVVASGDVGGATVTASGTVSGATVTSSGAVNGTSMASSGAITGTTITGSSNVTGANILTTGLLSATGDVSGGSLTTTGTTSTGNLKATLPVASLTTGNWQGLAATFTASSNTTIGQAVYVNNVTSKMSLACSNVTATMPSIALSTGTITADTTGTYILDGFLCNSGWTWTIGGLIYVDATTPGSLTQTAPAATGNQVQIVGVAYTATIVRVKPEFVIVEIK